MNEICGGQATTKRRDEGLKGNVAVEIIDSELPGAAAAVQEDIQRWLSLQIQRDLNEVLESSKVVCAFEWTLDERRWRGGGLKLQRSGLHAQTGIWTGWDHLITWPHNQTGKGRLRAVSVHHPAVNFGKGQLAY